MLLGLFHYQILTDILTEIHTFIDKRAAAEFVLEKISLALDSEGGTVFLADADGCLRPLAAFGAPLSILSKEHFDINKGVIGWVARNQKAIRIDDIKADTRFDAHIDEHTGFSTRGVAAAPVLFGDKLEGALEFVNKRKSTFNDADLELITLAGRELGAVLEKIAVLDELRSVKNIRRALSTMQSGVIITDPHEKIIVINRRAQEILGTPDCQIYEGADLKDLERQWPALKQTIASVLDTQIPQHKADFRTHIKGAKRHLGYSCMPLTDDEGTVSGAALMVQDITAMTLSSN